MTENILKKNKKKKGFTLIELIVVIAIIAIISLIAIPKVMGYQDSAKIKADIANAKTIATTTATLLADGKIDAPTGDTAKNITIVSGATDDDAEAIIAALQSIPVPQAKNSVSNPPASFIVHIDKNGTVTVDATGAVSVAKDQLYPTPGTSYEQ